MKKVHAVLFSFLMITMSMAGCLSGDTGADGEEGVAGPAGEDGSSLHMVVSSAELPDCDSAHLGQIYFVSGKGSFQVCSTTGWAVVDLTGPEGPAGADGTNGTNGEDGTNGTNGEDGTDGTNGEDGTDGSPSPETMLTSVSSPDVSMGCTAGGRIIAQGLDNGDGGGTAQNGVLESGEVDYTTTYCSNYAVSQVAEINSGGGDSSPGGYMGGLVGDTLYFSANDGGIDGGELWAHDTTNDLTWQVADISSGISSSNPGASGLEILVGDTLYFSADDGTDGRELWAHDTSNHSTWQVADIYSGSDGSYPGNHMEILVGDTLYFDASDYAHGSELWAHDTSNRSTWQVADINIGIGSGSSSNPGVSNSILVGDTLYFDADDGNDGRELWAHDTSNASTWQVADIRSGSNSSSPGASNSILVGDTIYFDAWDANGRELWAHDTSNLTTWQVADINSGSSGSDPGSYMQILVGDTLYFSANDGNDGYELWAHDTSNHSTWQVADINSESFDSHPGQYMSILVGDTLYFGADGSDGRELWAHDTSNLTTWQVADIKSGGGGSYPGRLGMEILVGDTLYFSADDGNDGYELWAHDTSNHSTWQVADINSVSSGSGSYPGSYMQILVGDTLYFSAYDGINGIELWAMKIEHSITYN